MMTNLFSSFDPTTSTGGLPLNWAAATLGLLFLPYTYWAAPSRTLVAFSTLNISLHRELKLLLGPNTPGGTIIFISLLQFIFFNNILGLFPYIFTSTSHLVLTLSLALPLWVSVMIYGWFHHTNHMFAHLVPSGTPALLTPLMVLIETISNLIRPGTLAVRLAANMIAGHLLLALLGGSSTLLPTYLISFLLLVQILLLLLETAVAAIQAYVFAALATLYAGEVN